MGFDEFRHSLENWAQQQLNADRPAYVAAFKTELVRSSNVESAKKRAEPFLEKPLPYMSLLTRTLDVEMARDRLQLATLLSGADPPDGRVPRGVWVVHQTDVWSICASGLLERIDKLVVAACRRFITDQGRREKVIHTLQGEIAEQRGRIKALRDAFAHGGGPVETGEAKRLWEVRLALGANGFRDVINAFHESCADRQSDWHAGFLDVTSQLISTTDTWFDRLAKEVF